jgi:hypothetical protein
MVLLSAVAANLFNRRMYLSFCVSNWPAIFWSGLYVSSVLGYSPGVIGKRGDIRRKMAQIQLINRLVKISFSLLQFCSIGAANKPRHCQVRVPSLNGFSYV